MTIILMSAAVVCAFTGQHWPFFAYLGLAILNSADDKLGEIRDALRDLVEGDE